MYRGRPWTIRQYAGYGSAEETNARFHYLLERGQTGLSVAFDLPTQLGYDSDDPLAEGEVGRTGVAIDSLADMEVLLDGIPLGEVSTSMTINAPAALLLLLYELVAEGQGVPGEELRGTVQNDVLKEYVARGNYIFPPRPSMRLATDLFAYCAERLPSFNTISISGYHIREAGASAAQELAFTLANGIAYCEAAVAAGLSPDAFGERLSFFFNAHNHFFQEVAKFRAARRLWARDHARPLRRDEPARARAPLPRADGRLDAHRPAAREQHRAGRDPGALRRERRRPVAPHELLRRGARAPDASAPRRSRCARSRSSPQKQARRTRQTRSAARTSSRRSPTSSSERARELIARVDDLGGAVAAIEQGFVQAEIEASAFRYQSEVESGERVVVGVNAFTEEAQSGSSSCTSTPRSSGGSGSAPLACAPSATRTAAAARSTRSDVSPETDANLLPPMREALRARCTVGEICGALRELWGTYDAQHA